MEPAPGVTGQTAAQGDFILQNNGKKLLVLLLGWGFMVLGVIGLFLPVLQGILFLLVGLFILSTEYVWAHRLLGKVRARFPAAALRCEEASKTAQKWLARVFHRREPPPL